MPLRGQDREPLSVDMSLDNENLTITVTGNSGTIKSAKIDRGAFAPRFGEYLRAVDAGHMQHGHSDPMARPAIDLINVTERNGSELRWALQDADIMAGEVTGANLFIVASHALKDLFQESELTPTPSGGRGVYDPVEYGKALKRLANTMPGGRSETPGRG